MITSQKIHTIDDVNIGDLLKITITNYETQKKEILILLVVKSLYVLCQNVLYNGELMFAFVSRRFGDFGICKTKNSKYIKYWNNHIEKTYIESVERIA